MQAVIEVEGLTHYYAPGTPLETKAIEDVRLKVYEGELLAVIGPAGSGKTTLVQHFNGLLKPTQGLVTVYADGRPTGGKKLWKTVGFIFQIPERQLFAETVFEEIAFGLTNMSCDKQEIKVRVVEALDYVGLDYREFHERAPLALSQGQQRRVAIASVLAMRPAILVMDEPSAGLDPASRKNFWANIQKMRQSRNLTIVLVTHNMDEVAELADRVVVMDGGRIVLTGPPREVFARADFIRKIGLEPPFAVQLLHALHNCGKDVRLDALTLADAETEIMAKLAKQGGA